MKKIVLIASIFLIGFNCNGQSNHRSLADVKIELDAAFKEAYLILKTAETAPLAPPKCEFLCDGTISRSGSASAEKFYNDFVEPENAIIKKLLVVEKEYMSIGGQNQGAMYVALSLAGRITKRAGKLIKLYGNNIDYFYPVTITSTRVDKGRILLGSAADPTVILDAIGSCATKIRNDLLVKFKTEHDYSLIQRIITFDKTAALLGFSNMEFLAKIFDAISFKLKYENELELKVDGKTPINYKSEGEVNVREMMKTNGGIDIIGKDKIKIIQGVMPGDCGDPPHSCISDLKTPSPFSFEVTSVYMDACKDYKIIIKGNCMFGPATEDWLLCATPPDGACGSYPQNMQGVLGVTMRGLLFQDGYITPEGFTTGGFIFEMPLQNNNVEAGKLDIVKPDGNGGFYKISLTLTHTPGK